MLESLSALIKTLPAWLATVTEILVVAISATTAITLLAGIWLGILIVSRRAKSITAFSLIPFRIEFNVSNKGDRNATEEGK